MSKSRPVFRPVDHELLNSTVASFVPRSSESSEYFFSSI